MAERLEGRGPHGAGGWLASACRLILTVRSGILLVTLLALTGERHRGLLVAALVVAAIASFVPLRWWDRVGPAIVRHPSYLAAELVLAALILVLTGIGSPFFFFTVGTALLGGLVYGWSGAALFSFMLVAVYFWVLDVRSGIDASPHDFQTLVTMPALYPVVAAAGAGARRLLDRQAEAEAALAEQERLAAAQQERARLARDMHDSLAKTVHGIGFAALALSRRIEADPAAAADDARRLAEDARTAAEEARELLSGLRGRDDAELRCRRPSARRPGAGRSARARRFGPASTTSGRCRRWRCASCAGSSRRRWPTSSATRTRARSRCTCAASATASCSPSPTTARASRRPATWTSWAAWARSAWPACGSGRGWRAAASASSRTPVRAA